MVDKSDIITVETLDEPPGIEVIDQLERLRYRLHTPEPVAPTSIEADGFHFPVETARSVTTSEFVLPTVVSICIRDDAGEMITEVGHLDEESVEDGTYILELSTQIKTYIEVDGPIDVTANVVETRVDFGEPRTLRLGARSRHERPAATVTTTTEPADMMAALSTFGSALKSTTPERSYPSLRGHPPAIEVGAELDIPAAVQSPQTGVRIEVPPTYEALYTVAPLAYYLGAELTQGPAPRLLTDTGVDYALDEPRNLQTGVERTLKQVFTLDCLTRTEGLYDFELHERNAVEEQLGLDFAALYDRPLAEQLQAYMAVPYAILEPQIPEWRLTAHVEPVSPTIEQLPFVVNDLAVVRVDDAAGSHNRATQPRAGQALTRDGVITRSAADSSPPGSPSYVELGASQSLEQAWIGDHIPIGGSKLTPEAFRNRFDRDKTDGDIAITIVLNDSRMDEERDLVDSTYGDRENLPFDVQVHRNLTVAELREVFTRDSGFLHYIGHTERDGFECTDGKLDAATLGSTGIDSFLLNACNSYQQGVALVEAGAIGGIVTLNDILNDGAVHIGELVAQLLNAGFPLRAALTIAREESFLGGQYIVVGDGSLTVTQSVSRVPTLLEIEAEADEFHVEINGHVTDEAGLGALYKPFIGDNEEYFLGSGSIETFTVSPDELSEFLQLEEVPIRYDDTLRWSSELQLSELR